MLLDRLYESLAGARHEFRAVRDTVAESRSIKPAVWAPKREIEAIYAVGQAHAAGVHDWTGSLISWTHIVVWVASEVLAIPMVLGALACTMIGFPQVRSKKWEGEAT